LKSSAFCFRNKWLRLFLLSSTRSSGDARGSGLAPHRACLQLQNAGLLANRRQLAEERVREAARRNRRLRFTALLHHITPELLVDSFYSLQKNAAAGVDGVTWREYEKILPQRVIELHRMIHAGAYRATPSRRVYIPKVDGRQRPLGIASIEDKIVQQSVVTVLNTIYEVDFLGFSYGFRPGRGQHNALDALTAGIKSRKVNWIVDADIRSFFDEIDHEWMLRFLEHRIADQRIIRMIRKWLQAGVIEDGKRIPAVKGTPQGAVISPLLANIYLHYAFDLWVQHWRKTSGRGEVIVLLTCLDYFSQS
jgi:RNA-directed DNA polymerase